MREWAREHTAQFHFYAASMPRRAFSVFLSRRRLFLGFVYVDARGQLADEIKFLLAAFAAGDEKCRCRQAFGARQQAHFTAARPQADKYESAL